MSNALRYFRYDVTADQGPPAGCTTFGGEA